MRKWENEKIRVIRFNSCNWYFNGKMGKRKRETGKGKPETGYDDHNF
jgi:hypothetical protein